MLTAFPQFKNLQLEDRKEIDRLIDDFRNNADHQFTSLWAWDLDNTMQVSILNSNLVIKMRDYLTGKPYYSFCGKNNLEETALRLLKLAKSEGLKPILKFLPEEMAKELGKSKSLKVTEDRDSFDYIIPIKDALAANEKRSRRKYLRQFKNRYNPTVRQMDMASAAERELIVKSATDWTMKKNANPDQIENEIPAMKRLITDLPDLLTVTGLFHEDKLIGFSIEQIIDKDYATGHFQRTDYDYRRCHLYLNHEVNSYLAAKKLKYINTQSDAGDLEMRKGKEEKYPYAFMMKKYQVELAS